MLKILSHFNQVNDAGKEQRRISVEDIQACNIIQVISSFSFYI